MDDDREVIARRDGAVGWVIVNRPAARNAMNQAAWRQMATALAAHDADAAVRAIVIRGAGDRAFISGADISEFPDVRANAEMALEYERASARAIAEILRIDKPVIGMVNGLCYGGGCLVLLACDVRLAADHARFAIPAVRLGLAYPIFGVERLVRTVGPTCAADMLLGARVLSAREARDAGLVGRVAPRAELENVAREMAEELAEYAPLTLAAHKRGIHVSLGASAEDRARLDELVRRCFDSADYQEGIAAFLEKRKPRFSGE